MLKLFVIQIVVTTLTDRFFFFLQITVMCCDINLNIHCKLATFFSRTKANVAWQAISFNVACRATKFAILQ